MIIKGRVIDKATGLPVPGASITITDQRGEYTGIGSQANQFGVFVIDTGTFSYGYFLTVSSVGYQTAKDELYDGYDQDFVGTVFLNKQVVDLPPVTVTAKKPDYSWLLLLAAIPVIASDKQKKVGAIGTETVVAIGAGLLLFKGFGLFNSLLSSLGLQETSGATQQENDPGSPWGPDYWRNHTDLAQATALGLRHDQFGAAAYILYHALGIFSDDWSSVKSVFDNIHSKAEVSYTADLFEQQFSKSMLTYLKTGDGLTPADGLSDAHMKILIDYVNNLPTT